MALLEATTHNAHSNQHWRAGLPSLVGRGVTLRELRPSDAPSLFAAVCRPEVTRHTWPPPPSVEAMARFIEWSWSERAEGKYICYGIVPDGLDHAVGLFELRQIQPEFFRGELGFVLDPDAWGTGLFQTSAELLLEFAFRVVKVHRVEARAALTNGRGNAALQKIGARHEGVATSAFISDGQYVDQNLWAIVAHV